MKVREDAEGGSGNEGDGRGKEFHESVFKFQFPLSQTRSYSLGEVPLQGVFPRSFYMGCFRGFSNGGLHGLKDKCVSVFQGKCFKILPQDQHVVMVWMENTHSWRLP